jgi:purine-binding chemotaxis protein CheW
MQSQEQFVIFHAAGQAYALGVNEVREIVPMAELSRPPGSPSILAGFLNLAGQPLPVIRLNRMFGLPDQPLGLYTPLLILRGPDQRLALQVDRVSQITAIAAGAILPAGDHHSFNDCVLGMLRLADEVVLLLSLERILLDKERQCIAELEAAEQERLRELEEVAP